MENPHGRVREGFGEVFDVEKGVFGGFGEKKYENQQAFTLLKGRSVKVKVSYLGLVKTYTNKGQDDIDLAEGAVVADLLSKLAQNFGKSFSTEIYDSTKREVKAMFTVMVNGVIIGQLGGVDTKLKEGDSVIVMPLMTGG